ncbi:MAG TPA: HAMP domain-containing histidine kinase [Actinobacteria bacterium]|nr:HAMP domain-containing histidine kinase [Actinomycetota bacterium]
MSLRRRLGLVSAASVAVAVVAVAAAAFVVARGELLAEVDASLVERMEVVARAADAPGRIRGPLGPRPFLGPPGGRPTFDTVYYRLTLPDGTALAPPEQELELPSPEEVGATPTITDLRVDGVHLRMITGRVPGLGVVQIARPLAEVDAALAGLGLVLSGIGLLGTLAAGVLGAWVARSTLRPVAELTAAAEEVAATGEFRHRVDVDREDELGRLARAFDRMLGALDASREQQRRLVRDAGHELRTPLTSLRTNIELLARAEDLPEEDRRALVASLEAEVGELSRLVAEIVELAADRERDEPPGPVDLGALAAEAAERWARRTGRRIEVVAERPGVVEGREPALRRAVDNLLDNAHKFGPADGTITIEVRGGRLRVVDRGPGIPASERERVFDRFYRGPAARAAPGSGLGLGIVAQVVADHGGGVFVEEPEGGGAAVGFELPTVG